MGKKSQINIVVHYPKTEAGRQELANRAAQIHADSIIEKIKSLKCPAEQKVKLLDAVIEDAKKAVEKPKKAHELVR